MKNLFKKTTLSLVACILTLFNISAQQGGIPTGSTGPLTTLMEPIVNEGILNNGGQTYYEVEFSGYNVLNDHYGFIPFGQNQVDIDLDTQMRYLWSFGDGNISFEANPTHTYAESGSYEVTLHATPIHSPKPPPSAFVKNISITNTLTGTPHVSSSFDSSPSGGALLSIKSELLRDFRGDHESSFIITYRNNSLNETISDKIEVFYDSAKLDIVEMYENRSELDGGVYSIPSNYGFGIYPLSELDNMLIISFDNLAPQETRRILLQFVYKGSTATFDSEVFLAANFAENPMGEVKPIQAALRRSWDPNAKEVFQDYIAPPDFPDRMKYRIFMENVGAAPTEFISVTDHIHDVLEVENASGITSMVDAKDIDQNVNWSYGPNVTDKTVTYEADINLSGQTEETNIEDSKYWFDVEYDLNVDKLEEYIINNNCKDGLYQFGKHATIEFDHNEYLIDTNIPYTSVSCVEEEVNDCVEIHYVAPNPVIKVSTVKYEVFEPTEYLFDAYAISLFGEVTHLASGLNPAVGTHVKKINFAELKNGFYELVLINKTCTSQGKPFFKTSK